MKKQFIIDALEEQEELKDKLGRDARKASE